MPLPVSVARVRVRRRSSTLAEGSSAIPKMISKPMTHMEMLSTGRDREKRSRPQTVRPQKKARKAPREREPRTPVAMAARHTAQPAALSHSQSSIALTQRAMASGQSRATKPAKWLRLMKQPTGFPSPISRYHHSFLPCGTTHWLMKPVRAKTAMKITRADSQRSRASGLERAIRPPASRAVSSRSVVRQEPARLRVRAGAWEGRSDTSPASARRATASRARRSANTRRLPPVSHKGPGKGRAVTTRYRTRAAAHSIGLATTGGSGPHSRCRHCSQAHAPASIITTTYVEPGRMPAPYALSPRISSPRTMGVAITSLMDCRSTCCCTTGSSSLRGCNTRTMSSTSTCGTICRDRSAHSRVRYGC